MTLPALWLGIVGGPIAWLLYLQVSYILAPRACQAGNTLVVCKLDRLGRSLTHLVETIQLLDKRGVSFRSLQEQLDTTTSGGRLIFHIFASLAKFERDLIRERTNAVLTARARGRKGGRPKGVDEKKRKAALALKRDPNYSIKEICDIVGIEAELAKLKCIAAEGEIPLAEVEYRAALAAAWEPGRPTVLSN